MLTQSALKEKLIYSPETGEWTWRVRRGGKAAAGSKAGWVERSTGYLRISVCNRKEYAHRLAFLYMTGELPKNDVDHIDCNPANCRWSNLRPATTSQNLAYRRTPTNRSGVRGVRYKNGKWEVRLQAGGLIIHRSTHLRIEDAAKAYAAASKRHHGEFGRTSA